MPADAVFAIESAACADATSLIAQLDADIVRRYPGSRPNGIDAAAFEQSGGIFVIGRVNGAPAVCGAIRPWEGNAEVKRMFVTDAFRRTGLARLMLRFLEQDAARRGYSRGVLETGERMHEAIALYASEGWTRIAPFGPYAGDPRAVCFEKMLK